MNYTPRKKKIHGPSVTGAMKNVRIDSRTEIMVDVNIPDDVTIARFLERIGRGPNAPASYPNTPNMPVKEEFKEVQMGTIENLAAVLDDSDLPETE